VGDYLTGPSDVAFAKVNDEKISKEVFTNVFDQQKRQLGSEYDASLDNALKQRVAGLLINESLLKQFSKKQKYITTNKEVAKIILSDENFKDDKGEFSLEKYTQLLRINGYSIAQYESNISDKLTQNQIERNLNDSAFITPTHLTRIAALKTQERTFSYITLNVADYIANAQVKNTAIEKFYQENKEVFTSPEQVKIDYIQLSLKDIANSILVSDKELQAFYQEEKPRFSSEEERQAQHILLKTQEKAEEVLVLIKKGGDFSELAKQHSQDDASKEEGGDLGFFARGIMVPALEKVIFSIQKRQVSDVIKSDFGFHIVKLNNINLAGVKPFSEVKKELEELYKNNKAQNKLYQLSEELATLSYEETLEVVSEQLEVPLKTSKFFSKSNSPFNEKVTTTAFSEGVFNNNKNSEMLETSKNTFIVLRLQEKKPQAQLAFDEIKDSIKTMLAKKIANKTLVTLSKKIVALLDAGKTKQAQTLIGKNDLTWRSVKNATRDIANSNNAAIIEKVFTLKKPTSKSTYQVSFEQDDALIIKLSKVETPNKIDANNTIKRKLLSDNSDAIYISILEVLKENADIKIFSQTF
jgi:peptidyl-prolyl cis-trans isomerase D